VCWPLPNGMHLHIGWSDAAGRMTLGLHVFVHGDAQQIVNLHHPVVTPIVPADTANLSDLRPLAAEALWLLPLITLSWLFLSQVILRPQSEPAPLEHPPRLSAAV
jgi:hypothetical protein